MKIINGQDLAEKIKDQIAAEIYRLKKRPNLAIILAGEREDSKLYVSLKEREAKKVGIDTHTYKCPKNISEKEIIEAIKHLNADPLIDAILVQLPLPKNFDTDKIIRTIDPAKDVDGFHPQNFQALLSACDHDRVMPPVYKAVLEMLKSIDYGLAGKKAALLCNSKVFGQGLAKVLECRGANAEIVFSDDRSAGEKTKKADLLITALGKKKFIKKEMIKDGVVIIDIGITKEGGKVYGDVDYKSVKEKTGFITPVPGGVGPLTIAMAFLNTLEFYKKIKMQKIKT